MADGTFDAGWLALREPADHRSRVRALVTELRREGRRRGWSRLVDLGTGTGSNLRFVSARVPWAREWTVVDHDAALLDSVQPPGPRVRVTRVAGDIAEEGLRAIDERCDVATASALIDLVPERWLREVRDRCAGWGCAAYFALTYDGTVEWRGGEATERDDALVLDAVNEHQRSDKGLGRALGPSAPRTTTALFAEAGYEVRAQPSPWELAGAGDARLVEALIRGWVDAAVQVRPEREVRIRAWGEARRDDFLAGARVRVGHVDILAVPPDPAGAAR